MDKKTGYLLILTGVTVLVISAMMVVKTLYGEMGAPQLFKSETAITLTIASGTVNVPLPSMLNQAANLTVFFMGMFVLAGIGSKIGRLGVQLVHQPPPPKEAPPAK